MDKSTLSTKRKKRKTRKCLDEIRNRSRRMGTNESISEKRDKVLKNNNTKSKNSLITMNRLTLAISRKAVKSETITRSQLANLRQKPSISLRDVVQGVVIESSGNSTNTTDPNIEDINIASDCDKKSQRSIEYCSGNSDKVGSPLIKYSLSSPKTPGSIILFSPSTKLSTPMQVPETNNSTSVSSLTSQVITTSDNLYYELMDEVQVHFKRLTAAMVHEDVIWKSKEKLRKLYIESRQQEYEDNIMNCIRSNLMPNTSDSPGTQRTNLNIRNNTGTTDDKLDFLKEYSVSLSESPECGFSEVNRTSDSEDNSSQSSPCMIFSPPKQAISDTPEYIFYPHRLNN